MAGEKLQYTVSAKDASSGVLRRVLGQLGSFSTSATRLVSAPFRALTSIRMVGLQASISMLRGLGDQIDSLVERGTRMEVVRKSFEALTGRTGPAAERLARRFQAASQGTLSMVRAMEIANRALASGLSAGDLNTALEFISKKSITTGKDAAAAIDTVITGLSRGSTLFLDDFGVLVDGIEGVARAYNAIHGSDAFENLGPAAQKAETVRAAMEDMRRQIGAIGITGGEAAFAWARIKTSITDSVDKLVGAVARSKAFQSVLKDISDIAGGIARSLSGDDQGQMLSKLWERAKDLLGAVFKDIGELLGTGLLEAIRKIWPRLVDGVKALGEFLWAALKDAAEKFAAHLAIKLEPLLKMFGVVVDVEKMRQVANKPGIAGDALKGLRDAFTLDEDEKPFGRTREVLGRAAEEFRPLGKDPLERQAEQAAARLGPRERAMLRVQITQNQARLRMFEILGDKRFRREELLAAEGRFQQDLGSDPALARLSPRERRERIQAIARENRQARVAQLQAEIKANQDRLNPINPDLKHFGPLIMEDLRRAREGPVQKAAPPAPPPAPPAPAAGPGFFDAIGATASLKAGMEAVRRHIEDPVGMTGGNLGAAARGAFIPPAAEAVAGIGSAMRAFGAALSGVERELTEVLGG